MRAVNKARALAQAREERERRETLAQHRRCGRETPSCQDISLSRKASDGRCVQRHSAPPLRRLAPRPSPPRAPMLSQLPRPAPPKHTFHPADKSGLRKEWRASGFPGRAREMAEPGRMGSKRLEALRNRRQRLKAGGEASHAQGPRASGRQLWANRAEQGLCAPLAGEAGAQGRTRGSSPPLP